MQAAAAPPAMAKALTSFTTPGGAAAWTAFASTSAAVGIITQVQQFNDQMRTGLTLGTLCPGAGGGAHRVRAEAVPAAWRRQSPAALAMLMQQGAQMGVGGVLRPVEVPGAELRRLQQARRQHADNAKQANAGHDHHDHQAGQPSRAGEAVRAGHRLAAIQSQQVAKAAQDAMNIKGGINVKAQHRRPDKPAESSRGDRAAAALKASLDAVLSQAGVGKAERVKIEAPPR